MEHVPWENLVVLDWKLAALGVFVMSSGPSTTQLGPTRVQRRDNHLWRRPWCTTMVKFTACAQRDAATQVQKPWPGRAVHCGAGCGVATCNGASLRTVRSYARRRRPIRAAPLHFATPRYAAHCPAATSTLEAGMASYKVSRVKLGGLAVLMAYIRNSSRWRTRYHPFRTTFTTMITRRHRRLLIRFWCRTHRKTPQLPTLNVRHSP